MLKVTQESIKEFVETITPSYETIQKEESKTWLITDPQVFHDKKQREIARYPMLAKQMGLNFIDTSNMFIADVGCGPFGGVSSVIPSREVCRIDPLTKDYSTIADTTTYFDIKAEEVDYSIYELVIVTNAMDHFENPSIFMSQMVKTMKPGAYFAHFHAIDNAITHPHPAHVHNINPEFIHTFLDQDFETVWELKYPEVRYAWMKYNGKVGQPAFCGLYRKTTGYAK